jgi:hypothetical protein
VSTLRYLAVEWRHEFPDEPVRLFSEIDSEGWEKRKIEEFRGGRMSWATAEAYTGETRLGKEVIPSLIEIAKDPQFSPREITAADFAQVWEKAVRR